MRKRMVSECMALDGVRQAPMERRGAQAVADQIGAAGGEAAAAQVAVVTHGQSSAMAAVIGIGGGAGRRSHMRQKGEHHEG
jgi:hypothetical protein